MRIFNRIYAGAFCAALLGLGACSMESELIRPEAQVWLNYNNYPSLFQNENDATVICISNSGLQAFNIWSQYQINIGNISLYASFNIPQGDNEHNIIEFQTPDWVKVFVESTNFDNEYPGISHQSIHIKNLRGYVKNAVNTAADSAFNSVEPMICFSPNFTDSERRGTVTMNITIDGGQTLSTSFDVIQSGTQSSLRLEAPVVTLEKDDSNNYNNRWNIGVNFEGKIPPGAASYKFIAYLLNREMSENNGSRAGTVDQKTLEILSQSAYAEMVNKYLNYTSEPQGFICPYGYISNGENFYIIENNVWYAEQRYYEISDETDIIIFSLPFDSNGQPGIINTTQFTFKDVFKDPADGLPVSPGGNINPESVSVLIDPNNSYYQTTVCSVNFDKADFGANVDHYGFLILPGDEPSSLDIWNKWTYPTFEEFVLHYLTKKFHENNNSDLGYFLKYENSYSYPETMNLKSGNNDCWIYKSYDAFNPKPDSITVYTVGFDSDNQPLGLNKKIFTQTQIGTI